MKPPGPLSPVDPGQWRRGRRRPGDPTRVVALALVGLMLCAGPFVFWWWLGSVLTPPVTGP